MGMKLIVLGSGTTVPLVRRNAPAYYLEAAGQEFLIDCGNAALLQLERAGRTYRSIDGVFITHTHPDHIGDLWRLIQALQYTPGFERGKPLSLFGPEGFREFCDTHLLPLTGTPTGFPLNIVEAEASIKLSGLMVCTVPTLHSTKLGSVAYRFESSGRSIVFSGDCDYTPGLVELAKGADLLVLDGSFPDALKIPGHLSASECGRIGNEAEPASILLSHLYPIARQEDKRLAECRAAYSGPVAKAYDLMVVDL